MSRWVRISNSKGRDAAVRMNPKASKSGFEYRTGIGQAVKRTRVIKSPVERTYAGLKKSIVDENEMARLLMESDPEIDFEAAGRLAGKTDRIYLDVDHNPLYAVNQMEIICDAHGHEIDRRPLAMKPANVNSDAPLKWSGRYIARSDAVKRLIFSRSYQLVHVDGLTFDFLFQMAGELYGKDKLVMIGAGQNGHDPILLEKNGLPYRGFLEGRVDGQKYLLVLHLSSLELKPMEHERL